MGGGCMGPVCPTGARLHRLTTLMLERNFPLGHFLHLGNNGILAREGAGPVFARPVPAASNASNRTTNKGEKVKKFMLKSAAALAVVAALVAGGAAAGSATTDDANAGGNWPYSVKVNGGNWPY